MGWPGARGRRWGVVRVRLIEEVLLGAAQEGIEIVDGTFAIEDDGAIAEVLDGAHLLALVWVIACTHRCFKLMMGW